MDEKDQQRKADRRLEEGNTLEALVCHHSASSQRELGMKSDRALGLPWSGARLRVSTDANTLFSDWARVPKRLCAVPYNADWRKITVDADHILVVDDEEAIREVVSTMLES